MYCVQEGSINNSHFNQILLYRESWRWERTFGRRTSLHSQMEKRKPQSQHNRPQNLGWTEAPASCCSVVSSPWSLCALHLAVASLLCVSAGGLNYSKHMNHSVNMHMCPPGCIQHSLRIPQSPYQMYLCIPPQCPEQGWQIKLEGNQYVLLVLRK